MKKTTSVTRPDHLSSWVLLTHPVTPAAAIKDFLEKIRMAERPLIRINYYPRYKYRFVVEFDLWEGLKHSEQVGLTEPGIAEVERIIKSRQHKTICTFCAGNCYACARYLCLEDAVAVANALTALADCDGMWSIRAKQFAIARAQFPIQEDTSPHRSGG